MRTPGTHVALLQIFIYKLNFYTMYTISNKLANVVAVAIQLAIASYFIVFYWLYVVN